MNLEAANTEQEQSFKAQMAVKDKAVKVRQLFPGILDRLRQDLDEYSRHQESLLEANAAELARLAAQLEVCLTLVIITLAHVRTGG